MGVINLKIFNIILILLFAIPFSYKYDDGMYTYKSLADKDSQFVKIDGIDIHYKKYGSKDKYIILLHGFGSGTYTWDKTIKELSEKFTVISFDRPGFGITERVFNEDLNPYNTDYHVELIKKIMDEFKIKKTTLIGNSAGGSLATLFTNKYPNLVENLILVDAAIYTGGGSPDFIKPFLNIPQINHLGPEISSNLLLNASEDLLKLSFYDENKIDENTLEKYKKPLKVKGYKKAFWEFTKGSKMYNFESIISNIKNKTIIIHGKKDEIIPYTDSIRLFENIENSELFLIDNCGHVPQEECPEVFINIIKKAIK